jgi:DNA-binding NtrC family response regulator
MSPSAQAKFLRVLQEREFQRLGGVRVQKTNVRVIAASNRDLTKAVERGDFREDLYYRLRVFDISLPPLRERRADILDVCEAFLRDIARSFGRPPAGLTHDAREALLAHDWPGNVRELRNTLERAAILCDGGVIGVEHLSLQPRAKPGWSREPRARCHRTRDDRAGAARLPLEQVESGQASRPLTHAALPANAEIQPRAASGRRRVSTNIDAAAAPGRTTRRPHTRSVVTL